MAINKENWIPGNFYTYKGETNQYYKNGAQYKFLGLIACRCGNNCGGAKLLFYSPAGVPMWEKDDHAIKGSPTTDFYNEAEMKVLEDSTIEIM